MEEALGYVWMSFGFAIVVLTVMGGIVKLGYPTLPMILILFGMPTFTTGAICKLLPWSLEEFFAGYSPS